MPSLTDYVHELLREVVQAGDCVIDATAGNGHDTVALARMVGPAGRVYACDVQPQALERTAERLAEQGLGNVVLLQRSHAELAAFIPQAEHGKVAAIVFNLGYLPGSDRRIVTRADSTLAALRSAVDLLQPGGLLTVMAYPGHPGGLDEAIAIAEFWESLPVLNFDSRQIPAIQQHRFTLDDFRNQMQQIRRMGPLKDIIKMIPGLGGLLDTNPDLDADGDMSRIEAIIGSMTLLERTNPDVIDRSRQRRIARGSGGDPAEVNKLLQDFEGMATMMKNMAGPAFVRALGANAPRIFIACKRTIGPRSD